MTMDHLILHLAAAQRLARLMLLDEEAARDAVQEAYLRAFRHLATFRGGPSRPWFLAIVRNTCRSALRERVANRLVSFDESAHWGYGGGRDPHGQVVQAVERKLVRRAMVDLQEGHREILILREIAGLSYKEISSRLRIPIGTVMSRVCRARRMLAAKVRDAYGRPGAACW
jgi:RNA polymerase sigma-70 factor (ECF subfamily)